MTTIERALQLALPLSPEAEAQILTPEVWAYIQDHNLGVPILATVRALEIEIDEARAQLARLSAQPHPDTLRLNAMERHEVLIGCLDQNLWALSTIDSEFQASTLRAVIDLLPDAIARDAAEPTEPQEGAHA